MRTTAEAGRPPAAATRGSGAGRRGRTTPKAEEPAAAPASVPAQPEPPAVAVTTTRLLRVDAGLYALRIGELAGTPGEIAGMTVPVAHVSAPFAEDGNGVEIVASFPRRGPWLGRAGGTMIVRSPPSGGYLIATAYGAPGQQPSELSLDLRRLDGPPGDTVQAPAASAVSHSGEAAASTGTRDVATEILLHIERAGDRLFPGRGWVGALGRRMRIEAFSIRPLEHLAPADLEMKGFLPNGGETPWVAGGALCGTRGRGLPLIGYAVRVVPQRADRFEVVYQGSFFGSGISEFHRDGSPCRAANVDDPLEAINIRLVERLPEPDETEQPEETETAD